jgi:hypothetical protein
MLLSDRHLDEMEPRELRQALADRNQKFRQDLAHEQRPLTGTIAAAVGLAVGTLLVGSTAIYWLLHSLAH